MRLVSQQTLVGVACYFGSMVSLLTMRRAIIVSGAILMATEATGCDPRARTWPRVLLVALLLCSMPTPTPAVECCGDFVQSPLTHPGVWWVPTSNPTQKHQITRCDDCGCAMCNPAFLKIVSEDYINVRARC